ncbi:hypothetical protein JR316_0006304 [Psilocybe cubensis]|nr:hypothetical protein JR316_0006304 [Psilocybe cubensis]KAH9481777.1 hypothetical protein JR316_0006304 [Psilocybe cubensis]
MMGNVTLVISEFLVGIYLFLRIYALYEKSRRILIMGVIASIISITILAVILAGKHQKGGLTGGGCDTGSAPSTFFLTYFTVIETAIAWGFVILNESVIFGLILYKIAENRRPSSLPTIRSFGSQLSLQELIDFMVVRSFISLILMFRVVIFVNVANMASYFYRYSNDNSSDAQPTPTGGIWNHVKSLPNFNSTL